MFFSTLRLKVKVTDVQSTDSRPLKPSSEDPDPTVCYLYAHYIIFKRGLFIGNIWFQYKAQVMD